MVLPAKRSPRAICDLIAFPSPNTLQSGQSPFFSPVIEPTTVTQHGTREIRRVGSKLIASDPSESPSACSPCEFALGRVSWRVRLACWRARLRSRTSITIYLTRRATTRRGGARSVRLDRHRGDLGTSASSHTGPLTVRAAMRLGHTCSRRRHRPRGACFVRQVASRRLAYTSWFPLSQSPDWAWTKPLNSNLN